ncbi:MAG: ABC transporter permease [Lachnospiraceae bacterium]|nr:ABC transporter permease [Lachnospiraceae bacterium]
MKFRDLLRLSTSNLFKRKLRTVLTVLGVMIGVASIVTMVSLGLGLSRSLTEEMSTYGSLTSVTVQDASNMYFYDGSSDSEVDENKHLDDDAIAELSQLPNVERVVPMIETSALLKSGAYEAYITLVGVPDGYLESENVELAEGTYPAGGSGQMQVMYGNQIINQIYNPKTYSGYWYDGTMADVDLMNDTVFFILDMDSYWNFESGYVGEDGVAPKMPKKHLFEASGIVAGGVDDYNSYSYYVYCNIDDLKAILKKEFKGRTIPGQPTTSSGKPYKEIYYNRLLVYTDSMDHVTDLQTMISGMGYSASSDAEWIQSNQKQMGYIQLVLGGIGAVSLLVAAIGIANTMMMSIYERTKEIGIMKVLGCDMYNIQGMFLIEAGCIGFIGGVVGLIISGILSWVINIAAASMGDAMGLSGQISYIPVWLAALSLVFAVLVGMLAGFFPSLRAMKLSPLAAIRNE